MAPTGPRLLPGQGSLTPEEELRLHVLYEIVVKTVQNIKQAMDKAAEHGTEAENVFPIRRETCERVLTRLQVLASAEAFRSSEEALGGESVPEAFCEERLLRANAKASDNKHILVIHQSERDGLHSAIEQQIEDRVQWLTRVFEASDTEDLVKEVGFQISHFQTFRSQYSKSTLQLAAQMGRYLEDLRNHSKLQANLIIDLKLNAQREEDILKVRETQTQAKLSLLRADVTKARMLAYTYDAESMKALKKIDHHLSMAEKEADDKIMQLTEKIQEYESLGPEYLRLARKYRKLINDLSHAQKDLQELQHEGGGQEFTP